MSAQDDNPTPNCGTCGHMVFWHAPIPRYVQAVGITYTRGACEGNPAGWGWDDDYDRAAYLPAVVCGCPLYAVPQAEPAETT